MLKINAIPLECVGNVKFGMSRSEVRSILGEATQFKKTATSNTLTDDFGYCHVFYNNDDKCEAVEIFDSFEIYVNNRLIFPTSKKIAAEIISDFEQDEDGLTSYELSIGIYAPDEEMESILFGERGYYE